jgi:hypothetical protein
MGENDITLSQFFPHMKKMKCYQGQNYYLMLQSIRSKISILKQFKTQPTGGE